MGYKEITHTADWAIKVWDDDYFGLLAESARGMNWISGVELDIEERIERTIIIEGHDQEGILVNFLSELVYFIEGEDVGFDEFDFHLKNDRLEVNMSGAPLKSVSKIIKAVTWHNLEIIKTTHGLEVEIVFDV